MKILMITESFPPEMSGSAIYAYEMAKRFGKLGIKTTIITRKFDSKYKEKRIKNVKVIRINVPFYEAAGRKINLTRFRFILTLIKTILAIYKNYDIIHLHSGIASECAAWMLKKVFRVKTPIVMTLHATFAGYWKLLYPFPIYILLDTINKKLIPGSNCDMYFVVDDGMGGDVFLRKNGVPSKKIKKHFQAVDTNIFRPMNIKKKKNTIAYIGRLDPFKGVDLVIKAMKFLPEPIRLEIYGNGPLKEKLISLTKKLNLSERVKFHDQIPHEKIPYYLNKFEILVLTDIRGEKNRNGLGLIMCEAMACKALYLTSFFPRKEWKCKTWISVYKNDPKEIANKILEYFKNKKKYEKIRKNAR
ncbi:MAG: glycosyltransferase family 4 protein, partial [Candidatus Aenigmatarchaeota archaeon]